MYRSFQTAIYCNPSSPTEEPANISTLQKIVQRAISNGQKVKAIGARHSISDIICTVGIPISMAKFNQMALNEDRSATFGAGTQIYDALEFLESHRLSLTMFPLYGKKMEHFWRVILIIGSYVRWDHNWRCNWDRRTWVLPPSSSLSFRSINPTNCSNRKWICHNR